MFLRLCIPIRVYSSCVDLLVPEFFCYIYKMQPFEIKFSDISFIVYINIY